ncbi:MAG: hypothetical protein Q8P82_00540, partial [bacterium]|nr:hypothetical protein [bacterium]
TSFMPRESTEQIPQQESEEELSRRFPELKVVEEETETAIDRKDKVGKEIVDQYLKGTAFEREDVSVEDTVTALYDIPADSSDSTLKDLGISKDKGGRYRLQNPERADVPGSWEKEERLKAFVVGFAQAETVGEKFDVIQKVYEYLGLPFERSAMALTAEEEKATNLPASGWAAKLRKIARPVALLIGLVGLGAPHAASFGRHEAGMPVDAAAEIAQKDEVSSAPLVAEVPASAEEKPQTHLLGGNEVVWNVVADILRAETGGKVSNADIEKATKAVCERNAINDEGVGAKGGLWDSRKLRGGMEIDVTDAYQYAAAITTAKGL